MTCAGDWLTVYRFLHASLQLLSISQCLSVYDIKEALEAFPARIEDAYIQTWNRILNQGLKRIAMAKAVLLWVLYSARSTTIQELQHAIATNPDDNQFAPFRIVPQSTLIGVCQGLVVLEEESGIVRLVRE